MRFSTRLRRPPQSCLRAAGQPPVISKIQEPSPQGASHSDRMPSWVNRVAD
jgi:hypothetical protein